MTTSEILTLTKDTAAQGYQDAFLISLLNIYQDMLYKHESAQTLLLDPATGRPFSLTTVSGTPTYDGPANSWRISKILVPHQAIVYENDYWFHDYRVGNLRWPLQNRTEYVEINGEQYFPFDFVSSKDAGVNGLPTVTFSRDPGDTTEYFYMQAYERPTAIESDRDQLSIPDSDGAHFRIVYPGFLKFIQMQRKGNFEDAMAYIETLRPKLWDILRGGAQGKKHRTIPRPY